MTHLDLFSGIGGFAYAVDQVWDNVEHIFCEWDKYCQQVLKKHWPESEVYGDIKTVTADAVNPGLEREFGEKETGQRGQRSGIRPREKPFILTGGFPCQPFSAAGLRRGTSDDRYLWPEMLRVIRLAEPQWVIAENVGGLVTWNDGMVFEQVCADLEAAGYEVQPFIIPAVAVNAPHRRDRIWFIGHAKHYGQYATKNAQSDIEGNDRDPQGTDKLRQPKRTDSLRETATNPRRKLWESRFPEATHGQEAERGAPTEDDKRFRRSEWDKDWLEVATEFCRVDDGVPKGLDCANQLKGYGNAIVPQVAIEIMEAIKLNRKG